MVIVEGYNKYTVHTYSCHTENYFIGDHIIKIRLEINVTKLQNISMMLLKKNSTCFNNIYKYFSFQKLWVLLSCHNP